MPKVSKYQVLGPYHERSLQGQAKQFCSYNFCFNCDVTRLRFSCTQEKKIEFRWDFVQGMLKELSYHVSDLVSKKEL